MEAIRQFIIRMLTKKGKTGIVTTLPKKDLVDFNTMILAEKFMQRGVDPNAFKNADQVSNMMKQLDEADKARVPGNMETQSAKVFDLKGRKIENTDNIMGGEELPPLGSRGGPDDIAAPIQSAEETLKNMIMAENKKNIAAMKQRRMLDEAIDNVSPGFSGDMKVDAELVAEDLATRMGMVYDDLPTKERIKLYDQALTGLSKKKTPPEDMAQGGRAGYKLGIGPLIELLTKASKTSPLQFGKNYMKNIKTKTLKANETGKFSDLPLAEAGIPAATGAFITNQVKKRLQSMNEEERQKNKDQMFKEISQEYKEMYKDKPEFLEKMLLSLHENIYMDKKADGGRIGYKEGVGSFETNDPKKAAKEVIRRLIRIEDANIPIDEKLSIALQGVDGVELQGIMKILGGELSFGAGKKGSDKGIGFNFSKKFNEGGRVGLKGGSLKKFLERRNFLKTIVGNSPEAENARTLQKILDEQKEFKKFLDKNPPVKFPAPGDKEYDDYILRLNQIMAKDRLKSATGGRIGYKVGSFDKARREFLKMLGIGAGTTAAAKSGILRFSDTTAPKVIEKVAETTTTSSVPPPYFFELAEKIKKLGKPDKVTYQERVEITRYTGKNGDEYELIEDLNTGDIRIIKDKSVGVTSGDKSYEGIGDRSVMEYRKGDADFDIETKRGYRSADEYDEYKVEFDMDGTEADADDMSEFIRKEIIEEATGDAPSIKKASGGIARMLGE